MTTEAHTVTDAELYGEAPLPGSIEERDRLRAEQEVDPTIPATDVPGETETDPDKPVEDEVEDDADDDDEPVDPEAEPSEGMAP